MAKLECFERLSEAEKTARFFSDEEAAEDTKMQTFEQFQPFDHSGFQDEISPKFGINEDEDQIFSQAAGKGLSE